MGTAKSQNRRYRRETLPWNEEEKDKLIEKIREKREKIVGFKEQIIQKIQIRDVPGENKREQNKQNKITKNIREENFPELI